MIIHKTVMIIRRSYSHGYKEKHFDSLSGGGLWRRHGVSLSNGIISMLYCSRSSNGIKSSSWGAKGKYYF
jgi:hypothetical protein